MVRASMLAELVSCMDSGTSQDLAISRSRPVMGKAGPSGYTAVYCRGVTHAQDCLDAAYIKHSTRRSVPLRIPVPVSDTPTSR